MPDARGWTVIVYTAIGASVISQIFYIRGNELIGANRAGLFINLVPIFGTLLSVLIVGETFQIYQALALVLVLAASGLPNTAAGRWRTWHRPEQAEHQKARTTPRLSILHGKSGHIALTSNCSRLAESIDLCALTCSSTFSGTVRRDRATRWRRARPVAAKLEVGDVDTVLTADRAQQADDAGASALVV